MSKLIDKIKEICKDPKGKAIFFFAFYVVFFAIVFLFINLSGSKLTYGDDYEKSYFQQVNENTIFTTDFGSYPVVLIKAREGKTLERLFDISYNSPEAIYKRPSNKKICNSYTDADSDMTKIK